MRESEFHLSDCCVKCPHFDEFRQTCTHNQRQVIIQEMAGEDTSACPIFSQIRAQSMQELEQHLSP